MPFDDDDRKTIPSWNGHPDTWRRYEEEVRIWLLGTKLAVEYSLAARLVQKLSGPARRVGLAMKDEDLKPVCGETPDLRAGVDNLMKKLKQLAPQQDVRRGGQLKEFFKEEQYKRIMSGLQTGSPAGRKESSDSARTA